MGAGAGGYVTIQLITDQNITKDDGSLVRRSRLIFMPAETPKRSPLTLPDDKGPTPGSPPAVKVALGGLTNAEVSQFNLYAYMDNQRTKLTGLGTNPDPKFKLNTDIAGEAQKAFGGDSWAGFAVALGPAGGRFDLVAEITLKPRWKVGALDGGGADKPFQVIPVVVAFGTDSFAHHYLLSLIVAQKTTDLVDTAVTQPYQ